MNDLPCEFHGMDCIYPLKVFSFFFFFFKAYYLFFFLHSQFPMFKVQANPFHCDKPLCNAEDISGNVSQSLFVRLFLNSHYSLNYGLFFIFLLFFFSKRMWANVLITSWIVKIVLTQRGKVSFAKKALLVQESGGVAVVVCQTSNVWPYQMTDSIGESQNLMIPCVMISQESAAL